jgi:type I restriction enzyme S subunit
VTPWPTVRLGEICSFKYGQMPDVSERTSEGYPVFSGYRIVGYSNRYHYEEPQVVVVARGVGGTGDIKWSPPKCFLTNLAIAILVDSPEIDKTFLYYRLAATKLWGLRTGSAQAQITIRHLRDYELHVPPLLIQQKIAAVLSAYDELIENNIRRIKILEEMAQRIYREWFVDYRYPGHEDVPLVDSDLGSIPEGWEVRSLGDVSTVRGGTTATKAAFVESGYTAYSASGPDGLLTDFQVDGPGVVLSAVGARCGRTWYATGKWSSIANTLSIRPLDQVSTAEWLYFLTLGPDGWNKRGSAQPFIAINDVRARRVVVPATAVILRFTDSVMPIMAIADVLGTTNTNLIAARDLLLPRLISGEVDVSDLDIALPEAAA